MGDYIIHYGVKRRSGRYPWGSGNRPYQSLSPMEQKGVRKKQELAEEVLGRKLTTGQAKTKNQDDNRPIQMKKGESVQHITGIDFGKVRSGQLYVTATDYDNALYESFLSMNLLKKGWNPAKVALTLKEDLNVPTSSKQKQVFSDMLKTDRKTVLSDIRDWLKSKGKDAKILNDAQNDSEALYDLFMNSVEKPSNSQSNFYKRLRAEGYNGVLDDHDITGSWMQGRKPIILMDALNTVGDIKITDISKQDMIESLNKWLKMNS